MRRQQSAYYAALNAAQRGDGEVSGWLSWFVDAFATACQGSATLIDESLVRAHFWSEHRAVELNTRQRKVLDKMLEAAPADTKAV
jgi:Fic family protein